MKTREQFRQWLLEHEVLGEYILYSFRHTKMRFYGMTPTMTSISSKIRWTDTPQGFTFWSKLNVEYLKWIKDEDRKRDKGMA